jgi:hypothetical protein
VFRLWRTAKSGRERNKQLVRLWELCEPEIRLALKAVAKNEPSVEAWLDRRGLTFEQVAKAVFPAVMDAASNYDPGHESGAGFPTFAMKHITGEVARLAKDSLLLAGHEGPEDRAQEELHAEELPPDPTIIVAWARQRRTPDIVAHVYEATKYSDEYSSEDLRRMAGVIEEEFAEDLEQEARLRALHNHLLVMSVRAEDYEGKMVNIGTLWHLLLIRDDRRARGMPRESYSAKALARTFGRPSDKTLAKWLRKCDEQGITSRDWTPEQLARVIRSRRGPRFRGRRELPNSRPKE